MKRRREVPLDQNFKLVLIFCCFVFFLIFGSLFFKLATIFSKSKFDGHHQFNMLISTAFDKKEIIGFSPDNYSISVLKIKGKVDNTTLINNLSLPIEGKVIPREYEKASILDMNSKSIKSNFQEVILHYNDFDTNLTIIDFIRIWFFTLSVPVHSISVKEVSFDTVINSISGKSYLDSIIPRLFVDNALSKEQLSIQIINATGVSGVGNKLAKIITNIGGNVVSVSTADSTSIDSEIIYSGKKTYTLEKLSKLFNINTKLINQDGVEAYDIIIKIGKNKKDLINI